MKPTQDQDSELAVLSDVEALVGRARERVKEWERLLPAGPLSAQRIGDLLDWLLLHNLKLWQLEDRVRHEGLPDGEVVHTKRLIDLENQARNERVEQIDRAIVERLTRRGVVPGADAPLHTESPGLILDRLSILVLRTHMLARRAASPSAPPAQVDEANRKHHAAMEQLRALCEAAGPTFAEFFSGRRRFFVTRMTKQYGR